ncbi:MAG: peptide deformylase [Chloroflexi bacterium]|nr:peptide deformylase [Chloroflexota bacterium]
MATLPILTGDHPVLRQKAKKVGKVDKAILRLLDDMTETVQSAPGLGLAANQVGRLVRVIVIWLDEHHLQLINPEVVRAEGEVTMEEGCLSLPGYWADVRRPEKITVRALSRNGKPMRLNANGMLARVLQHEIDHLDGILFVDRLDSIDQLHYTAPDREDAADSHVREPMGTAVLQS